LSFVDIGVSGFITILVLAFAAIAFLKGIVKLFFALLTVAAAITAAWWGYHFGHDWLLSYWAGAPLGSNLIICIIAGIGSFLFLHKVFSFLINPFEQSKAISPISFGIPAALLGVVLASAAVYFGMTQLRSTNNLTRIDELIKDGPRKAAEPLSWQSKLKDWLYNSKAGKFVLDHDPLWDEEREKLVKLTTLYYALGPNTLPGNDKAREAMLHPNFQKTVVLDDEVMAAFKEQDAIALWKAEAFDTALEDDKFRQLLAQIDIEESPILR